MKPSPLGEGSSHQDSEGSGEQGPRSHPGELFAEYGAERDYEADQGKDVEQAVRGVSASEERYWDWHFWARGYFCATVGQMTEEMIKQYLEHHFEAKPNDDFKMEPE